MSEYSIFSNFKLKVLIVLIFLINFVQAQHARTEHWNKRNRQFFEEFQTIKPGKIVFLGNSITEGFDLNLFFPEFQPVNRGIVGDHIDGLLERIETSVFKLQPSKLFILIGINDIGAGDPDSLILSNYKLLFDTLSAKLSSTEIFIHSVLPTTKKWKNCPREKIVRLNEQIKQMTVIYNFTFINLYPLFSTKEGYLKENLTRDGLHLNLTGYKLWADLLKLFLVDEIDK